MFLTEQPEARSLHAIALGASLAGDFSTAYEAYGNAEAACLASEEDHHNINRLVQFARIVRDHSFTNVREAIIGEDPTGLDLATDGFKTSLEMTDEILRGALIRELQETDSATANGIVREVFAEHGATLGLIGRTATVRAVLLDINTRGDGPVALQERGVQQRAYREAHRELRKGNNGYYLLSNAMAGARQEVLNGQLAHVAPWLKRAVMGLAWTARYDRHNWEAARNTFWGRLPHLRGYETARASVLTKA